MPTAPSVTNGTTNHSGGSVTLYASGTGTLNWYNAATGGTLVNTGTSYTIPSLTSNETFYVENDVASPAQSVGMASASLSTSTGGYYTATGRQGLVFDADEPLTINTVTVYEETAGSRTIWLRNSSGTYLDSITTSVAAGTQTITLNLSVPTGTGYVLGAAKANDFWRETTDASFPYSVTGLISITGNTVPDAVHYYYFYNWQVTGGTCESKRVPVMASIVTGINELSEGSFALFPNPNTGSFDIKLNDLNIQNATISIANMLGQTVFEKYVTNNNVPIHIDASNLQQGMYYVKIQTDKSTYTRKVLIAN
jgi:hypothetical protein